MTTPPDKITDVRIITKTFNTAKEFSEHIEQKTRDGNYMDTIIEYCRANYIELESAKKLVTKALKEKIRTEAEGRKMLSKKKIRKTRKAK